MVFLRKRSCIVTLMVVLSLFWGGMHYATSRAQHASPHVIESNDPRVVQAGQWQNQNTAAASNGSYLYSSGSQTDALALSFVGTSLEVIYIAGPRLGTLAVEIDGTVLRTVITTTDQITYAQSTRIDYLTNESHVLRVFGQAGSVIAIDAFVIADSGEMLVSEVGGSPRLPCNVNSQLDAIPFETSLLNSTPFAITADGHSVIYATNGADPTINEYNRLTCVTSPITSLTNTVGGAISLITSDDGQQIIVTTNFRVPPPPATCTEIRKTFWIDRRSTPPVVTQLEPDGICGIVMTGDLSSDGRYYASYTGNTLYVRDLFGGVSTPITHNGSNVLPAPLSDRVAISGDGRYVFFETAQSLVASDNVVAFNVDVYVYDRPTGSFGLAALGPGGVTLNGALSRLHDVSTDGRYVVFSSTATNLGLGNLNGEGDVLLYDRQAQTVAQINVAPNGTPANGPIVLLSKAFIAGDGRSVVFASGATNLVANDTNASPDVFVRNLAAGTTTLISASTTTPGVPANGDSQDPVIATSGHMIAFVSAATDLVPGIGNGTNAHLYLATNPGVPAPVETGRLARFTDTHRLFLSNSLENWTSLSSYTLSLPVAGYGVMGDWDGNGTDTPGIYGNNGVFYYTNTLTDNPTWSAIWIGLLGRPAVAGRLNGGVNHDCIGVVDSGNFPPYGLAFALYFTCDFTNGTAPALTVQWLSVILSDAAGFSGTHQFAAGDFNNDGVASIAIRRGLFIAFTNIAPTTFLSEFSLAQYWGTPSMTGGSEGLFLAGDFDNTGGDSFAVYYPNGNFYYRNTVEWNPGTHLLQQGVPPTGNINTVAAWR